MRDYYNIVVSAIDGQPLQGPAPYSQKPERRHYNERETPALSDFTNNSAQPAIKVVPDKSTNDKEDFIETPV